MTTNTKEQLQIELKSLQQQSLEATRRGDFAKRAQLTLKIARVNRILWDLKTVGDTDTN
jgi:hypothetical protein